MIEHPAKLLGLLGSAATVAFSGLMANAGGWMTPAKEFVLFLTAVVGLFGVIFYTLSIAFDVMKKWREEREAKRREIREIEDAICRRRVSLRQCPLYVHEHPTDYEHPNDPPE